MRNLYYFYIALAVISALLVLDQVWVGALDKAIFFKLLITIGILGGVAVAIQLIRDELIQQKQDRDDKFSN
jgi:hypothetical protein